MTSRSDNRRLQEAFTEAARGITPSPVPLTAILRDGRTRKRRRAAALTLCCGLVLALSAAAAIRLSAPDGTGTPTVPAVSVAPATAAPALRVVAPGEQVEVMPGVRVWLTAQGKHSSTPDKQDEFRSAGNGNLAAGDASSQSEGVAGRMFLSGLYLGEGDPARVEIVTLHGTVSGHLLTLAGHPGWGMWYADGGSSTPHSTNPDGPFRSEVHQVTVYDTAGKVIAQFARPGGS
jgi:hypothetical protein